MGGFRQLIMVLTITLSLLISSGFAESFIYKGISVPDSLATAPRGINDSGLIVGSYTAGDASYQNKGWGWPSGSFLYDGSDYHLLDIYGAQYSRATSINNNGQIVGTYLTGDNSQNSSHGYLYDNGVLSTIDIPGARATSLSSINDNGDIVGNFIDNNLVSHNFLYNNGGYSVLDASLPASKMVPMALNNLGQIVGYTPCVSGACGFIFDNGAYTFFQLGEYTTVWDINNNGEIVGDFTEGGIRHGFLYSSGTFYQIDYPILSEGYTGPAFGLNDSGDVVGGFKTTDLGHISTQGFLALNDGISGTPIEQVKQWKCIGTQCMVPEPTTMLLLGLGLIGLAGAKRKFRN